MINSNPLFYIPYWSIQFNDILPYHDEMAAEVTKQIQRQCKLKSTTTYLAHQTMVDPFTLPSRGWALLESRCNEYYQSIVKENFQRWRSGEFHIRRWAIKYGTLSDEEILNLNTHGIHNHLPALFSSIYYLRIPDELSSNDKGGTKFSSPWGAIMDLYMPRSRIMHAVEGLLIVFPSFIDHTPVPVDWTSKYESRIVISTDLFFVSGEQLLKTDTSVIKVKPMDE